MSDFNTKPPPAELEAEDTRMLPHSPNPDSPPPMSKNESRYKITPLSIPPAVPWNPRTLNTYTDEEALMREHLPNRYNPRVYENGHSQLSGMQKAKLGYNVIVIIVLIVLVAVGVSAGVYVRVVRV